MKHLFSTLVLTTTLSFSLAAVAQDKNEHKHGEHGHSHGQSQDHSQGQNKSHGHHQPGSGIDVSNLRYAPAVKLHAIKDEAAGWNLHLQTENFVFTPEKINEKPVLGQGHAHLYIDGKKIARLYGPWFHLGKIQPGHHEIKVVLNANDHAPFMIDGKEVASTVMIHN